MAETRSAERKPHRNTKVKEVVSTRAARTIVVDTPGVIKVKNSGIPANKRSAGCAKMAGL